MFKYFELGKRRYNLKLWKVFSDVFNVMPICAIIEDKIICMHGGISPLLTQMEDIINLKRPVEVPDKGLLCDILWSDPDPAITGWQEN
jgi:serine/threonine-protein phosphatase PP1 catalytic subunit